MKNRRAPFPPPLIFWGGAGKAYALLIAAGLLGASPAGARSYGSGPRVEGGRVVVTDDGFSRDDARDNGLADRFEVAREDAPREMTAAEAVAFCRSYAERRDDAGRWRVPTQRELMQAVIVRVRLTGLEPFDSEVYWSSSAVPRQFGEEERYGVHMRTGALAAAPQDGPRPLCPHPRRERGAAGGCGPRCSQLPGVPVLTGPRRTVRAEKRPVRNPYANEKTPLPACARQGCFFGVSAPGYFALAALAATALSSSMMKSASTFM